MAWVVGNRDTATFKRLYEKVKHLKDCIFYTDGWDAFAAVLPQERHIVGKAHTYTIEGDNSDTRHHIGRFTRRTKVVSRCDYMVHLTLKAWVAVAFGDLFATIQSTLLSIF